MRATKIVLCAGLTTVFSLLGTGCSDQLRAAVSIGQGDAPSSRVGAALGDSLPAETVVEFVRR